MVLKRLLEDVRALLREDLAQCPLVDRAVVLLEVLGGDERLEDEQTAEVDAPDAVGAPGPGLVERGRPGVGPRGVVVGVLRVRYPCVPKFKSVCVRVWTSPSSRRARRVAFGSTRERT